MDEPGIFTRQMGNKSNYDGKGINDSLLALDDDLLLVQGQNWS